MDPSQHMDNYDPYNNVVAYDEEEAQTQPQRIDQSLLVTTHQWATQPELQPSFQHNVLMNPNPRADMVRLKAITERNHQDGTNIWSEVCKSKSLFRVPDTLTCDRTFARDSEEVYYLDHMDSWLNGLPEDITINDIPLIKRSLFHRLMYGFSRRAGYLTELFERRRTKMWLPYDHPENRFYSDVELSERYPGIEAWLQLVQQPTGMPVPTPFVVFYFASELREAQRRKAQGLSLSERQRRLLFCLANEYYILFLATWWSEALHAGRQFVLSKVTVETLTEHCKEAVLIGIKPAQVILDYMQVAVTLSCAYHVWLSFRGDWMEESTIVWAKKGTGVHDPLQTPVRTTLVHDKKLRRLTITGHSSRLYKRNTILNKKVADPDLDKIPGLLQLVQENNWNIHGDMRVRELLTNLMNVVNVSRRSVDTLLNQGFGGQHRTDREFSRGGLFRPIGYYGGPGYGEEHRHREEQCENRIRFGRDSPPPPPRRETFAQRSEYYREDHHDRGYENPRPEHRGYDCPQRSPNYTPPRVYEIEDQARISTTQANPVAPSQPQGDFRASSSTAPTPHPKSTLTAKARALMSPNQPCLARSSAPISSRNPAPLRQLLRDNCAVDKPQPTKAFEDPLLRGKTVSNPDQGSHEITAAPRLDDSDALTNTDFTKQPTGNVSWLLGVSVAKKHPRDEQSSDQNPGEPSTTKSRKDSATGEAEPVPSRAEDPATSSFHARHPSSTAYFLQVNRRPRGNGGEAEEQNRD